ncbi:MAG: hypothetical protein RL701_1566 [Pseudomonadota bacterium]
MTDIHSDKAEVPVLEREPRETAGNRLAAKRAAKAARKAATRGTTNSAEEVAQSVNNVSAWLGENSRTLLIGAGAIAAGIAGVALFSSLSANTSHEAGTLLHTAVTTSHGLIVAPEETPPEDAIVPTFANEKERDEKALGQFREVGKKFADSSAGHYAALGEANTLLNLGRAAEASAAFEKLRTALADGKDTFLRVRVLEGAGYALEGQQKYAEARERFEALSKLDNGAYRVVGDYHRARMLVAEGKRDEAKQLLEVLNKAEADKPADGANANEPSDRFESIVTASQTLLAELGGQPAERATGASSGISQQVLDTLRKQLSQQKK